MKVIRYEPLAIKRRLTILRYMVAGQNKSEFARRIGVIPTRWYNVENGSSLTIKVAYKILNAVPGMTISWLFEGREGGLPPELRARLKRAEYELFPPSASSRHRRATR